jgi:hypothetical protein
VDFQPGEVVTVEVTREMRARYRELLDRRNLLGWYLRDYSPIEGVIHVQYPLHLTGYWLRFPKVNIKRHPG